MKVLIFLPVLIYKMIISYDDTIYLAPEFTCKRDMFFKCTYKKNTCHTTYKHQLSLMSIHCIYQRTKRKF